MTNLIQIFLPVVSGSQEALRRIKAELVERFGGVTAYTRSTAEGLWRDEDGTERDEIVIVEVMANDLDQWWQDFRGRLEQALAQKEIVVRAQSVDRL